MSHPAHGQRQLLGYLKLTAPDVIPNGANIIRRGKNLKQKALKRHGYTSVDAIATLITNGKGLMSAYGERLSPDDINGLAQYVLGPSCHQLETV